MTRNISPSAAEVLKGLRRKYPEVVRIVDAEFERLFAQHDFHLRALKAEGDYRALAERKIRSLQEQVQTLQHHLDVETDSHRATSDALACEEDALDALREQLEALQ